jgi:hypothetical protein
VPTRPIGTNSEVRFAPGNRRQGDRQGDLGWLAVIAPDRTTIGCPGATGFRPARSKNSLAGPVALAASTSTPRIRGFRSAGIWGVRRGCPRMLVAGFSIGSAPDSLDKGCSWCTQTGTEVENVIGKRRTRGSRNWSSRGSIELPPGGRPSPRVVQSGAAWRRNASAAMSNVSVGSGRMRTSRRMRGLLQSARANVCWPGRGSGPYAVGLPPVEHARGLWRSPCRPG